MFPIFLFSKSDPPHRIEPTWFYSSSGWPDLILREKCSHSFHITNDLYHTCTIFTTFQGANLGAQILNIFTLFTGACGRAGRFARSVAVNMEEEASQTRLLRKAWAHRSLKTAAVCGALCVLAVTSARPTTGVFAGRLESFSPVLVSYRSGAAHSLPTRLLQNSNPWSWCRCSALDGKCAGTRRGGRECDSASG